MPFAPMGIGFLVALVYYERNAGMTSLAKRRMDFKIFTCGMPPKLKVVVNVSK
jgi:hypothetical protein